MFSPHDLHFGCWSLSPRTMHAKDSGLVYRNYPQISELRKSDHMAMWQSEKNVKHVHHDQQFVQTDTLK